MEQSTKEWPIILDETSFSYLVELSQNLSKVEGLVKKLVKGEYQQWSNKDDKLGQNFQNFTSAENHSWGNWPNNSKTENQQNNNESEIHDWDSTNDGEASNDKNNNSKCEGWNEYGNFELDWSKFTAENETSLNWDTPIVSDKAFWESGWEKPDSKESNQKKLDWDSSGLTGW